MKNYLLFLIVTGLVLTMAACAHEHGQIKTAVVDSEEGVESAVKLEDLQAKIARYVPITVAFDVTRFDERGLQALDRLLRASRIMDELFWEQATAQGKDLRQNLSQAKGEESRLLARYLAINYGPYDRLDGMAPFIQVPTRPAGATFYPENMSKDEFQAWITAHPEQKKSFQSWFTVIRRQEDKLLAVPYSEHYQAQLQQAAKLLKEAAELVDNESLATFLRSRADAFLSNQYTQSDMDWMDVQNSDLEVTIGPYEVYEDHLFNYKAAFESFITMRDAEESKKLSVVAKYLTEMEQNLPIAEEHKNFDRGALSPVVVADLIYSAGDTRAGVQTLAFNLPNDETVRESKGSKKVMLKNISHAKFDHILTPIAKKVLLASQQNLVSFDAYFNHTLMHEVSHGLGPGRIMHQGEKVVVSLVLKDLYSSLEEAKADTLGVYNTLFMIGKKQLPAAMREQSFVTFLAGSFRSVRFGIHEAHGKANLIIFNYLVDKGAYLYHAEKNCFEVVLAKAESAFTDLARDLLMLQALGDYANAQAFVDKYAQMSSEMKSVIDSLGDIPVDITPQFEVEKLGAKT